MFEWLKKQEKIVVILLLAIPFVNWIVELICRGERMLKELDKKPEAKENEASPADGEIAPKAESDNKEESNSVSEKAVTSIVMFILCFPAGTLLGWVDLVMYLTGNKFILED